MAALTPPDNLFQLFENEGFVTRAPSMEPILKRSLRAAQVSDIPLLIEGETGTGKSVLAHAIHRLDPKRRGRDFVVVNCSALPESLAESELFGHRRGAFSGAWLDREGLLLSAQGGTVLLDDVNNLAPAMQAKLLDTLQRKKVRALGSDRETTIDVRVIAASNESLAGLAREGRFRADLYYRLNVVLLRLPPLRERPGDVRVLVERFARSRPEIGGPVESIGDDLVARLESLPWPGNVRELENLVHRMLLLKGEKSSLGLAEYEQAEGDACPGAPCGMDALRGAALACYSAICEGRAQYSSVLAEFERRLLERALAADRTRAAVARRLAISERSLYYKLRTLRPA